MGPPNFVGRDRDWEEKKFNKAMEIFSMYLRREKYTDIRKIPNQQYYTTLLNYNVYMEYFHFAASSCGLRSSNSELIRDRTEILHVPGNF